MFSEAALFTVVSREHIEDIKGTTITFDEEVLELLKSITCDVLNIKHSEDIVIDLILQSILLLKSPFVLPQLETHFHDDRYPYILDFF